MPIIADNIRSLLVQAEEKYNNRDLYRFKVKTKGADGKSSTEIGSITYTEFKRDAERFSKVLKELSEQGKHIAILGTASVEWLTAYFGTTCSGSVAVPLDSLLTDQELCTLINRADVTTLVFSSAKENAAKLACLECPDLKHLISMGVPKEETALAAKESNKSIHAMAELMSAHDGGFDFMPDPDSLSTIMFTSGTTGLSKGVMLSHRNQAHNATSWDLSIPEGTVALSVLPIHHAYCLSMDILKGLSVGATVCINDSLLHVAKNLELFKPDMMLLVPLMIETFAKKLEEKKLIPAPIIKAKVFGNQFHTIYSGGAYLNPDYISFFKKYGIKILQGYGMTECSPLVSTNLEWKIKEGSVGKLMPGTEVRIEDGEIWLKSESVMQGYYKMPEETEAALSDGWLKTGDLGYVDEEDFLFLTGRKKNLIITKNGENVSPEEIENKLSENRLIAEVIVRENEGVIEAEIFPDQDYVKKKKIKDIKAALQEIIDDYNKKAATYKRIYGLKVRDREFEKNTTKKIKRY